MKAILSKVKHVILKPWKIVEVNVALNKFTKKGNSRKLYLIGTPNHGNLGDQAITYAQIQFIKDQCKDIDLFEIHFNDVKHYIKQLTKRMNKEDIIMLQGGGNLGVEYFKEEQLRRKIIRTFTEQKVLIMPQTIDFGSTDEGRRELKRTQEIYNAHPNLAVVAREEKSFEMMKRTFYNNSVFLTPDIVMYVNKSRPKEERKDILFCFRKDKEKVVSGRIEDELYKLLSRDYTIKATDTVVPYRVNKETREKELNQIWSMFRKSRLIVTDRLHGMLFALITSTPCIAFSNYNYKVKGTYKWISQFSFITFVEKEEEVFQFTDKLLEQLEVEQEYNHHFAMPHYEEIRKFIDKK
ncbi:polysaccharide pyruvyl transferase family protein [Oceanobacillus bengalensis]|uniref:polysaccharide pyruvyl transferase family protein n=1 Tax=Oceanobacillus bengalensis TaxID=1435466 RepID=UPI001602E39C|nr:polysaccharide pyruvyl transferase family protein [Oceanobacillus bengalensis]